MSDEEPEKNNQHQLTWLGVTIAFIVVILALIFYIVVPIVVMTNLLAVMTSWSLLVRGLASTGIILFLLITWVYSTQRLYGRVEFGVVEWGMPLLIIVSLVTFTSFIVSQFIHAK